MIGYLGRYLVFQGAAISLWEGFMPRLKVIVTHQQYDTETGYYRDMECEYIREEQEALELAAHLHTLVGVQGISVIRLTDGEV
jgi:hypothetical protein